MGADDVHKGLKRNDAELAVTAFLKLPPEARAPHAAAIGALFRASVAEAHRRGDWGRLDFWAARASKDESLVGAPGSDDAARCWWALLWGALRTKDFARADLAWQRLEPVSRPRAPALADEMKAFVESKGTKLLGGAPPTLAPDVDPRLGYEATSPKRALPPMPTDPAGTEPAVLALCALHPWGVFADSVSSWSQKAPAALKGGIKACAVKLAVRELLLRAQSRGALEGPAALIGALLREGEAPAELAQDVLLAFRVVSSHQAPGPFVAEMAARPYCLLAAAAARYPENMEIVSRSLEGRQFSQDAVRSGLRLVEELLRDLPGRGPPGSGLPFKALGLWAITQADSPAAVPEWLGRAFDRLAQERVALTATLNDASPKERIEHLEMIVDLLPVSTAEEVFTAVWDGASEEVRRTLGRMMHILLERVTEESATRGAMRRLAKTDPEDIEAFDSILDALLDRPDEELSAPALRLFARHESKLVALDRDFLTIALGATRVLSEARQRIDLYVRGKGPVALIEAASAAAGARWGPLVPGLIDEAIAGCGGETRALAEAFHAAQLLDAPKETLRRIGRALLAAFEEKPSTQETVKRAVQFARKAGARLTKKKPKRTKKPRSKQDEIPF
jgi:hypothetical protein